MRNYKSLKKIIIILVIFVIIISAIFAYVLINIKNKNENISELHNKLISSSVDSKYLESMQNMVNSADASISQIEASILKSDGDVLIIEKIEQLAKKNGLEVAIDSIAVEDLASLGDSGMTTLKIRAKTIGAWTQVYNFISELVALPYKIRIEGFSLVNNPDITASIPGSNANQWQNVFEIRLLKYK